MRQTRKIKFNSFENFQTKEKLKPQHICKGSMENGNTCTQEKQKELIVYFRGTKMIRSKNFFIVCLLRSIKLYLTKSVFKLSYPQWKQNVCSEY